MAGSASTITYEYDGTGAWAIPRIKIEWTSDDTTGAVTATTKRIAGTLLYAVTVPDGTAAPSANYDIAITDEFSIDVLSNLGGTGGTAPTLANRHTSNTEKVILWAEDSVTNPLPGARATVNSTLAVAVTNAGNSKQGTIYLYWVPSVVS